MRVCGLRIPARFLGWLTALVLLGLLGAVPAAEYTVRPGDTLSGIAKEQLGEAERWRDLAVLNNIARPEDLKVGQVLRLPAPRRAGDPPRLPSTADDLPPSWPLDETLRQRLPSTPAAPPAEAEPGWLERMADLDIVSFLLVIAASVAIGWLLLSLALKIACWFLFIESPWGTCLYVAFLMALIAVAALLILYALAQFLSILGVWFLLIAVVLFAVWFAVSLFAIRRVYRCAWRTSIVVAVLWMLAFKFGLYLTYVLIGLVLFGLLLGVRI